MRDDLPSRTFVVTPADPGAIEPPFDVRSVFGRARPPVRVAIGPYCFRSTVAVMNGRTFVPFRRSHREAAGIVEGQALSVTLTLDTADRTVEVPVTFALHSRRRARGTGGRLSASPIAASKTRRWKARRGGTPAPAASA